MFTHTNSATRYSKVESTKHYITVDGGDSLGFVIFLRRDLSRLVHRILISGVPRPVRMLAPTSPCAARRVPLREAREEGEEVVTFFLGMGRPDCQE